MKTKFLFLIPLILSVFGCKTKKQMTDNNGFTPSYKPGPPTIVYKTKKDYYDKVPVILNDEKTKIVAYFSPKDFIRNGKVVYPTKLENGYLLDNIGITKNVAFTSFTIETYTKSMRPITVKQLYNNIIDKDPLLEMYDCGNRNTIKDPVNTINNLIKNSQLTRCKKLK